MPVPRGSSFGFSANRPRHSVQKGSQKEWTAQKIVDSCLINNALLKLHKTYNMKIAYAHYSAMVLFFSFSTCTRCLNLPFLREVSIVPVVLGLDLQISLQVLA